MEDIIGCTDEEMLQMFLEEGEDYKKEYPFLAEIIISYILNNKQTGLQFINGLDVCKTEELRKECRLYFRKLLEMVAFSDGDTEAENIMNNIQTYIVSVFCDSTVHEIYEEYMPGYIEIYSKIPEEWQNKFSAKRAAKRIEQRTAMIVTLGLAKLKNFFYKNKLKEQSENEFIKEKIKLAVEALNASN